MNNTHAQSITARRSARSWRSRLFRIWLAGALPWLALVAAASVHDHQRAIDRVAGTATAIRISLDESAVGALSSQATVSDIVYAVHWLQAAIDYCAGSVGTYGLLPASLTFFLFVLFLPWADQWSRRGTIED